MGHFGGELSGVSGWEGEGEEIVQCCTVPFVCYWMEPNGHGGGGTYRWEEEVLVGSPQFCV